jgi:hypothetical protein
MHASSAARRLPRLAARAKATKAADAKARPIRSARSGAQLHGAMVPLMPRASAAVLKEREAEVEAYCLAQVGRSPR